MKDTEMKLLAESGGLKPTLRDYFRGLRQSRSNPFSQGDRIFESPCTWRYRERWLGSAGCGGRSAKNEFWMLDGTLTGEDAIALPLFRISQD